MRKMLWAGLFLMGWAAVLHAQPPAIYESMALYKEATELFDKEKYGAAESKYQQFIEKERNTALPVAQNDLVAEASYKRGVCAFHLLRNNTESLFQDFITRYPAHPDVDAAWYYVGKLHFIKREYKEAIQALEHASTSRLGREAGYDLQYMLGYCHYTNGNTSKAKGYLNRARKGKGKYAASAAYFYAVICYQEGKYSEALNGFESVPKDSPYNKDLLLYKANCLLKLGNYDELQKHRDELLQNGGDAGEAGLVFANASYEQEDYQEAATLFSKYDRGRAGLDRTGNYRMGVSLYNTGKYKESVKYFERVVGVEEDEIAQNAFYRLGHAYLEAGDMEKARMGFRQAADQKFDKEISENALYQYAKVSFVTRDFDEALDALRDLLEEYPSTTFRDEASSLIGEILLYASNYKEAIEYLENESGLKTSRSRRAYQRASQFYALDLYKKAQYDLANEYFRKAVNYPEDAALTRQAYFWMGESQYRNGDYNEALRTWETYVRQPQVHKDEEYASAYYGMGYARLKQQKWEDASRNFERFISLADRGKQADYYIDAHLRAGDMELMQRHYEKSGRYYQQVADINRRGVDYALFQLGIVKFQLKDFRAAVSQWERLVRNYRRSEWRDDALQQLAETYLVWITDYPNAYKYASMLSKDHPDSPYAPGAYLRMGIAELKSGQDGKATIMFKTVLYNYCWAAPEALAALENLSAIVSSADYDQIESEYRRKCPDAQENLAGEGKENLDYNNAMKRYFEDDMPGSAEKFRQFLANYPYSRHAPEIRYYFGEVLLRLDRENEALEVFKELYEQGPVSRYMLDAIKRSAEIYLKRKNYLTALELFTMQEQKAEDHQSRVAALFGKAECYIAMGDFERARGEFIAIDSDPNTTEYSRQKAQLGLAKALYELGRRDEARTVFANLEKELNNVFAAESQYYLARILYDEGKYEQSKEAIFYQKKEYSSHNYWKAKAFLLLAEDYLALGDTTMAVKGTLKSLIDLEGREELKEIPEEAKRRRDEIEAVWSKGSAMRMRGEPRLEEDDDINEEEGN